MIEADGWETVYCSAPMLERLARLDAQRIGELLDHQDAEAQRMGRRWESFVVEVAAEVLKSAKRKAKPRLNNRG